MFFDLFSKLEELTIISEENWQFIRAGYFMYSVVHLHSQIPDEENVANFLKETRRAAATRREEVSRIGAYLLSLTENFLVVIEGEEGYFYKACISLCFLIVSTCNEILAIEPTWEAGTSRRAIEDSKEQSMAMR